MIWRLALVVVLMGLAWLGMAAWERRSRRVGVLRPGITVITGPACRLCEAVIHALSGLHGVSLRVVEASEKLTVRSVPAVFVVGSSGEVLLHRSGRAAVSDVAEIARAAREAGVA